MFIYRWYLVLVSDEGEEGTEVVDFEVEHSMLVRGSERRSIPSSELFSLSYRTQTYSHIRVKHHELQLKIICQIRHPFLILFLFYLYFIGNVIFYFVFSGLVLVGVIGVVVVGMGDSQHIAFLRGILDDMLFNVFSIGSIGEVV